MLAMFGAAASLLESAQQSTARSAYDVCYDAGVALFVDAQAAARVSVSASAPGWAGLCVAGSRGSSSTRAVQPTIPPRRRRPTKQTIRPSVEHILGAITGAAAFVRNGRLDILEANPLGQALYSPMFESEIRPANSARFVFLDPRSRDFYVDWSKAASDVVAVLRAEAGRDPYDRCLSDLVGELSTQSNEFRALWAQHNVRQHITGIKHFHHPIVGDLSLTYDRLDLVADAGLTIFTYTAEPGSRHEETLRLLGSWATSNETA